MCKIFGRNYKLVSVSFHSFTSREKPRQFLRVHRVCERRHARATRGNVCVCKSCVPTSAVYRLGGPRSRNTGGLDSSIRRTRICTHTTSRLRRYVAATYATEIVSRGADGNIVLTMNCGAVIAAGVRPPRDTVARNYIIEILSREGIQRLRSETLCKRRDASVVFLRGVIPPSARFVILKILQRVHFERPPTAVD